MFIKLLNNVNTNSYKIFYSDDGLEKKAETCSQF